MLKQVITRSLLFLFITLLWSCSGAPGTIDIRGKEISVDLFRLDSVLFATAMDDMPARCLELQEQTGDFFQIYVEQILRMSAVDDPMLSPKLVGFVGDPDWQKASNAIQVAMGSMVQQRADFNAAFSRLKVVYPEAYIPPIIVYNSGFNYGVFPTDSTLGIGAEWFVGAESDMIKMLDPQTFPNYMKERMNPEMIVPSGMKGWLITHYADDARGQDVLTHLISMGKIMVLMDKLLPETPTYLQLAFKPEQLTWCEEQEFEIWRELVDREMLYSKKQDDIGRLMNDGPFTNGFPRKSPGHIGEWIGKRMVEHYWSANPELSLRQVMETKDPRQVLKYYKP